MLPIYFTFLAGQTPADSNAPNKKLLLHAAGFVIGFSVVFILVGGTAAALGAFFIRHMRTVQLIGGMAVMLLGLNFIGLLKIPLLNKTKAPNVSVRVTGFMSAILFGMIFSISWTPCIGAFLGSALMMAAQSESFLNGVALLFFYCLGLGIPFMLAALFMQKMQRAFTFMQTHHRVIHIASGIFLVGIGFMMILGLFNTYISFFD